LPVASVLFGPAKLWSSDDPTFKLLEAALTAVTVSGAALVQRCCAKFTSESSKSWPSLLQCEIANTVRVAFVAREYPRVQVLEEQVLERGGAYSVDIQLVGGQIEGLGVVVEVDGPLHFLRGGTDRSALATRTGALDLSDWLGRHRPQAREDVWFVINSVFFG
jgi:hypothetical protein